VTTAFTIQPRPRGKDRARPPRLNVATVKALVRHRDGYRCRLCGVTARDHVRLTGRTLDVHRLQPGSRYTVRDCISVCKNCHYQLPKSPPGTRKRAGGLWKLSIKVPSDLMDAVRQYARNTKRTIKAVIELALEQHLIANGYLCDGKVGGREPDDAPAEPRKRGRPRKEG